MTAPFNYSPSVARIAGLDCFMRCDLWLTPLGFMLSPALRVGLTLSFLKIKLINIVLVKNKRFAEPHFVADDFDFT